MNNKITKTNNKPLKSSTLAKQLFKADVPEKIIRKLPPQTLFMAIRENGLQSSADLLEIMKVDQMRVILDFDCWNRDIFNEDNFWEWLAITDATDNLDLLGKILAACDLKWICMLLSKYVLCEYHDEPTDMPPGDGYYTPDKGYTWVSINIDNADKEFYLNRLLALIFDTNIELFYQLLSIQTVQTQSMLEEESFQDKEKRLRAEGVHTFEESLEVHSGYSDNKLISLVKSEDNLVYSGDITVIEPLLYDTDISGAFDSLIKKLPNSELALQELTKLINSAIVRWNVPFSELPAVRFIGDKIKGALNIGIELASQENNLSSEALYSQLGLTPLYKRGLFECLELRKKAFSFSDDALQEFSKDEPLVFTLLAHLREDFPELPLALQENGNIKVDADGKITEGSRVLNSTKDLTIVEKLLAKIKN